MSVGDCYAMCFLGRSLIFAHHPAPSLPTDTQPRFHLPAPLLNDTHFSQLGSLGRRVDGKVATQYDELLPGAQFIVDPAYYYESQVLYGIMLAHFHAEQQLLDREDELVVRAHLPPGDAPTRGLFPAWSLFEASSEGPLHTFYRVQTGAYTTDGHMALLEARHHLQVRAVVFWDAKCKCLIARPFSTTHAGGTGRRSRSTTPAGARAAIAAPSGGKRAYVFLFPWVCVVVVDTCMLSSRVMPSDLSHALPTG